MKKWLCYKKPMILVEECRVTATDSFFRETLEMIPKTMNFKSNRSRKDSYSAWCSEAVTHVYPNPARRCLTLMVGRENI